MGFKAANRESFPYIMHIVDEPRKFSPSNVLTYTVYTHVYTCILCTCTCITYYIHIHIRGEDRAAPIMLLILPIILSRISFKVHLLF